MTAHRIFHMKHTTLFLTATLLGQALVSGESVTVDSQADWEKAIASSTGVAVENGTVSPMGKTGQLKTKLKRFDRKRSASVSDDSAVAGLAELESDRKPWPGKPA